MKRGRKVADYESWDWSKTNSELAAEHSRSYACISMWRGKLGKPRSRGPTGIPAKFDFSGVDWTLADAEIARLLGCTRERVRQKRHKHWNINSFEQRLVNAKVALEGVKLATEEDFKRLGVCLTTGRRYCAALGVDWERKKPDCTRRIVAPWERVNWRLPNAVIQQVYALTANSAANHRYMAKKPKAVFTSWKGSVPAEFVDEVDAEYEKASEWFAKKGKP